MKIGFIYLTEILEFYPDLAKKKMQLLIEYKDNIIRNDVLQVEQKYDYYCINSYSEKDKES